jgi:hypothetical protein
MQCSRFKAQEKGAIYFYAFTPIRGGWGIRKVKDAFAFTFLRRDISPVTPWQLETALINNVKVEKNQL